MIKLGGPAVLMLVLVACRGSGTSASALPPSASRGAVPSDSSVAVLASPSLTPSPRPTPTVTPTARPAAELPFAWQTVRVRVNGLAVRREPSPTAALVAAYPSNRPDEVAVTDGTGK